VKKYNKLRSKQSSKKPKKNKLQTNKFDWTPNIMRPLNLLHKLSSVHWRRNCFADRTTTHTI